MQRGAGFGDIAGSHRACLVKLAKGRISLVVLGLGCLVVAMVGTVPGSLHSECLRPKQARVATGHGALRRMDRSELEPRKTLDGAWILTEQVFFPSSVPFQDFDIASLYQLLQRQPDLLGPASLGTVTRGELINGLQLVSTPGWLVQDQNRAWGTPELIHCLQRSIMAVHEHFPETPPLHVGDLSREEGGYLKGHASHQSGLDADVGFFYHGENAWYQNATAKTLDRERTWMLVRSMVTDCAVEYVFMDREVLAWLREHASKVEGNQAWLESVFSEGPSRPGILRHADGHRTHMHVRVHDLVAETLGKRLVQARQWAADHPKLVQERIQVREVEHPMSEFPSSVTTPSDSVQSRR